LADKPRYRYVNTQSLRFQIALKWHRCILILACLAVRPCLRPKTCIFLPCARPNQSGGDKQSVEKFGNIKLFQQIDARYALMIFEIPKERFLCVSPTHAELTNKIACQIISNQQLLAN